MGSANAKPPTRPVSASKNERFRVLCQAICASELGASIPTFICHEIAEFGHILLESALLTAEEESYLIEMIESQRQTEYFQNCDWKLLCRGSRDGKTPTAFHDACDGHKYTVCLMDVEETGWICGGYASTEWKSTDHSQRAKDDDAFLFVIRPKGKRHVFHRQRDKAGNLLWDDCGVTHYKRDGFNFGAHILFWGHSKLGDKDLIRLIRCRGANEYFDYKAADEIIGKDELGRTGGSWTDFEVYQLNCVWLIIQWWKTECLNTCSIPFLLVLTTSA